MLRKSIQKRCSLNHWSRIEHFKQSKCCCFQSLSHVQLFATPWTAAHQTSLSFTIAWSLLKFMSIELVMLSNYLILCRPLLLLPSIFPSIRVFSNESALLARWSKYWSFSISPSNECLGLLSFRIDWFDLLAVQRTLKNHLPVPVSFGSFKPGRLQSMGSQSVRHDWATFTFLCIHMDMVLSEKITAEWPIDPDATV